MYRLVQDICLIYGHFIKYLYTGTVELRIKKLKLMDPCGLTWYQKPLIGFCWYLVHTLTAPDPLLVPAWAPWIGEVGLLPSASTTLAVFIPSNNRMSKMLDGRSSTGMVTNARHSGHLNSRLVLRISSKHLLQKVCWHGRTLLFESSLSRQTEHSNSSFKVLSSMTSKS